MDGLMSEENVPPALTQPREAFVAEGGIMPTDRPDAGKESALLNLPQLEKAPTVEQKTEQAGETTDDNDNPNEITRDQGLEGKQGSKERAQRGQNQTTGQAGAERLRRRRLGHYLKSYHILFEETAEDASSKSDPIPKADEWPNATFGLTLWTAEEKDRFFNALDKRGRGDMKGIATVVGTKSEPEIQSLIMALEQSVREEWLDRNRNAVFPEFGEYPAAQEVSLECEEALEDKAIALARLEFDREAELEKKSYGDFWLLDSTAVEKLETMRDSSESERQGEEPSQGGSKEQPQREEQVQRPEQPLKQFEGQVHEQSLGGTAAQNLEKQHAWFQSWLQAESQKEDKKLAPLKAAFDLLDLGTFIDLSQRLYMNTGSPVSHLEELAELTGEGPALMCSAFIDFYNIVLSKVNGLVSACLFIARSRIKKCSESTNQRSALPNLLVSPEDVQAALGVVGFHHNYWQYWQGVASRCDLTVYESIYENARGHIKYRTHIPHSTLECRLAQRPHTKSQLSKDLTSKEDGGILSDAVSSVASSPKLSVFEDEMEKQEIIEESHDIHAETLDARSSWEAELELWDLLGMKPRSKTPPAFHATPQKLKRDFDATKGLVDWRDCVDFKAEWEAYQQPLNDGDFEPNRKRKRRRRRASSNNASGVGMPLAKVQKRPGNQENLEGHHAQEDAGVSEQNQAKSHSKASEESEESQESASDVAVDDRESNESLSETSSSVDETSSSDSSGTKEASTGSDDEALSSVYTRSRSGSTMSTDPYSKDTAANVDMENSNAPINVHSNIADDGPSIHSTMGDIHASGEGLPLIE